MKKIALLVTAFALIIGMTQCKKKAATPVSDNSIQITLSANNGGNDKTVFDGTGFTWSGTEIIYVGGNSTGYLGYLTSTSIYDDGKKANFSGSINNPDGNETLYFFYLGKGAVKEDPNNLDFSKQDGTIGNVTNYHIAMGSAAYSSTNTYTDVTFDMKMAIARFNTKDFDGSVYIHGDGIYSAATVDYNAGTITGTTKGYNLIGAATTDCYVAMIPQPTPAETNVKFESSAHSGELTFVRGIEAGKYYCDNGGSLAVNAGDPITGVVKGLFAVEGASGIITKMVRFAPGNLRATNNTANSEDGWTWSFAPTQYSIIGNATANTAVGNNVVTTAGTVDLFGWVGEHSELAAYGINNNDESSSYGNTVNEALKRDWGDVAKAANLGGHNNWCTLTKDQWVYVFQTRTDASNKYGHGSVNGLNGMIILPDVWVLPSGLSFKSGNSEWANSYTIAQWALMEENGAVFLLAEGSRNGTEVSNVGSRGCYWSSTSNEQDAGRAYSVYFDSSSLNLQNNARRYRGYSVRLARVVE
ncbi:MAG: hypothetical protein IKR71_00425 [Bacteroidales bacterium]|nr:hypothetical protein [Bacteroidales bacterium]